MASSAKMFSFLFLLSLLFSQQALARDSVFFSKVSSVDNNNVKETELPNKQTTVVETKQQEQEPTFIPQTQKGYGLYGHESTESTTAKTEGEPFTTTTENEAPYTTTTTTDDNNNIPYTHYNPKKNNEYYNGNMYETNQNGMSDTRLTQKREGYTTSTTPTNYQNSNNYYNVEKQGMSDTRFLENGKYFYDTNSENNYNPNQYRNSQVVDSRNWYNNNNNNRQYYGNNNNKGYYGNSNGNQNTYESHDVYQNEEFQESEDDQFVP